MFQQLAAVGVGDGDAGVLAQRGNPSEVGGGIQAGQGLREQDQAVGQKQDRVAQRHGLIAPNQLALDCPLPPRVFGLDGQPELPRGTIVPGNRTAFFHRHAVVQQPNEPSRSAQTRQ